MSKSKLATVLFLAGLFFVCAGVWFSSGYRNVAQVLGQAAPAAFVLVIVTLVVVLVAQIFYRPADREKKGLLFAAVFCGLAVLSGLAMSREASSQSDNFGIESDFLPTDKSEQFVEIKENLYRNTRYGFRIKFPEGWEIKGGDGSNVLVKAVKAGSSIGVLVKEFPSGMEAENYTTSDVMTLGEFVDSMTQALESKFPGAKVLDSGETKIDNVPAYWVEYTTPYSALGVSVVGTEAQYHMIRNGTYYTITAGAASEDFSSLLPLFQTSIATFVFED